MKKKDLRCCGNCNHSDFWDGKFACCIDFDNPDFTKYQFSYCKKWDYDKQTMKMRKYDKTDNT